MVLNLISKLVNITIYKIKLKLVFKVYLIVKKLRIKIILLSLGSNFSNTNAKIIVQNYIQNSSRKPQLKSKYTILWILRFRNNFNIRKKLEIQRVFSFFT